MSVQESWEDVEGRNGAQSEKNAALNVNAPAFVPNVAAATFIPIREKKAAESKGVDSEQKENKNSFEAEATAQVKGKSSSKPATPPTPKQTSAKRSESSRSIGDTSDGSGSKSSITKNPNPTNDENFSEEAKDFFHGKEAVNIIFIGHVDAGKSTMGGHILFLTGQVDKRTLEKFEREAKEQNRESWYLSWALDTNAEERAKGKTVEVGRATFETERRRFVILDAPGHKNFVPNMIGGASQADVGILVISARKGEYEAGFDKGGQTREHAILAKTAGVKKLVVAVNKMDDGTVNWSKDRYDECRNGLTPFLKQCGFNPKTELVFLPLSGFTGVNLKDRVKPDVCDWYSGPSLLELLDDIELDTRPVKGPLLIPVSEKYKDMGVVVGGKIESGTVKKGDHVHVLPHKGLLEVSAIFLEEEEVERGICGDYIRIRFKGGVDEDELGQGFVVCDPGRSLTPVTRFRAQLMILEHKSIICAGYSAMLHIHTLVEEVSLAALLHLVDKKTGKRSKGAPRFVKKGHMVIAELECPHAVCITTFKELAQLGRFTLRDEGKTIAMGKVTKLIED